MSQNMKSFLVALPLTLLVVVGGFFAYSGYGYSKLKDTTREVAGEGNEIKIGTPSEIVGFYPDIEDDEITSNINSIFLEGLVRFDKNFRIEPLLAESWNNPDDKTWKIYLKKNVNFSDGSALKASDIKFTFDYLKEKEYPMSDYISAVEEVKVVDDYTVDIKTKEPYPILMNKLTNIFILSEKNVTENGIEKPIGTGPYRYVEWVKGDHLTVERNEKYHGKKPMIKKVTFLPIEKEPELAEKIKKGEIDIASLSSNEVIDKLKENNKIVISTQNDYGVTFLMPNYDTGSAGTDQVTNPLLNKKIRKALYYGIDIDNFIAATTEGTASPASQLTTSAIFGYNSAIKRYPYDLEKAKLLLKEAGYENGLEMTALAFKSREKDLINITEQLAKLNIKLKTEYGESPEEIFGKAAEKNFSFILLNWANSSGDTSDLVDNILATEGSSNLVGYSNGEIDALSKKASSTLDMKKRKEYLGEAMKITNDEAAFIPLLVQKVFFVSSEKLIFEPRADSMIKAESLATKKIEIVKKTSFLNYMLKNIGL